MLAAHNDLGGPSSAHELIGMLAARFGLDDDPDENMGAATAVSPSPTLYLVHGTASIPH